MIKQTKLDLKVALKALDLRIEEIKDSQLTSRFLKNTANSEAALNLEQQRIKAQLKSDYKSAG